VGLRSAFRAVVSPRPKLRSLTHALLSVGAALLFLLAGLAGYEGLLHPGIGSLWTDSFAAPGGAPPPVSLLLTLLSAVFSVLGVLCLAWSLRYSPPRLEPDSSGQQEQQAPPAREWQDLLQP
jgi:hypothetical protein